MACKRLLTAATLALLLVLPALAAAQAPPRAEHPRPDLVRSEWLTLNGSWQFEFDDEDRGLRERWFAADRALSKTIVVPYPFQARLSGNITALRRFLG